jgi:hypothetical protein
MTGARSAVAAAGLAALLWPLSFAQVPPGGSGAATANSRAPRLLLESNGARAGTSAQAIIAGNPELAFRLGQSLFQRNWGRADGLYLLGQNRAVGATASSCAMCHNLPFGSPGAGGTVFDPPGVGRNAPHLFGVGKLEAMASLVSHDINRQYDKNGNGILERDEFPRSEIVVQIAAGTALRLGSLKQDEASLNPALKIEYLDRNGRQIWTGQGGAPVSLGSSEVAAIRLALIPFGASISDHQFAAIDDFTRGVFLSAFGMRVTSMDRNAKSASGRGCAALGVTSGEIDLITYFLRHYPTPVAPARTRDAASGLRLFEQLKCAGCHVPDWSMPTSPKVGLPALGPARAIAGPGAVHSAAMLDTAHLSGNLMEVRGVFTDLLHHDVGPRFYDAFEEEGKAYVIKKFKTPPLWGAGSSAPYGHDGRSPTLDHVIRRHGGEAAASVRAYVGAAPAVRQQLLAYLASLRLTAPGENRRRQVRASMADSADYQALHAAAVEQQRLSARAGDDFDDVCSVSGPMDGVGDTSRLRVDVGMSPAHALEVVAGILRDFDIQAGMAAQLLAQLSALPAPGGGAAVEISISSNAARFENGTSIQSPGDAARFVLLELRRRDISQRSR